MPTPGPCKRPGVFYYFEIYTIQLFPPRLTKGPVFFIWVNGTSNGGIPKRHNAAPGGFYMAKWVPATAFFPPPYLIKGPWGYMVVDTGNGIFSPAPGPGLILLLHAMFLLIRILVFYMITCMRCLGYNTLIGQTKINPRKRRPFWLKQVAQGGSYPGGGFRHI